MRKVIIALCGLAAPAVALSAAFGPRANPDDQFRFFWLINESFYPEMVASGFNTFIQNYWGRYSVSRGTYKDTAIVEKHKLMDRPRFWQSFWKSPCQTGSSASGY